MGRLAANITTSEAAPSSISGVWGEREAATITYAAAVEICMKNVMIAVRASDSINLE
jgi:hypothetical protein